MNSRERIHNMIDDSSSGLNGACSTLDAAALRELDKLLEDIVGKLVMDGHGEGLIQCSKCEILARARRAGY